jgi:hypothetical protein
MTKLKDFLEKVGFEYCCASDLQQIVNNYAFSLTVYNKFHELWEKL